MKVLKFGGTSVGTVESIAAVLEIVKQGYDSGEEQIVVLSAMGGVTNLILEMADLAVDQQDFSAALENMENRHFQVIKSLIPLSQQNSALMPLKLLFQELENVLKGVQQLRELSPRSRDLLMSFGEQCSAFMMSQIARTVIPNAQFVDARQIIRTDSRFGHARVHQGISDELIQKYFEPLQSTVCFVTGFIGADAQGCTTTLGRGGSDYSAALIASALHAELIEIWTDVDGMLTADPRLVGPAFSLEELSYTEAMELSYFGTKVIYPPTMIPAFREKIPIVIRNTFNPDFEGTFIKFEAKRSPHPIRGISSIDKISIIHLAGSGMVGEAGFSGRLFSLFCQEKISIVMITQGSSEHSITVALDPADAQRALSAINSAFELEINAEKLHQPHLENDLSVLAIVGENMKKTPGMAGKFFQALGENKINVRAIAQGSSEYNISVIIQRSELHRALNAVHHAFFSRVRTQSTDSSSVNRVIHLFALGTGNIGSAFFRQIAKQQEYLCKTQGIDLRLVGVGNSRKMHFNPHGILPLEVGKVLTEDGEASNLQEFLRRMKNHNLTNTVFIDNTASVEVSDAYLSLLKNEIHVVTSNKIANSSSFAQYRQLRQAASQQRVGFLYETNVGAGLPVISVLNELLQTGDEILKIEAVLSGTISYIFNHFHGEAKFHEVVMQAQQLGYTEPDPRDDLNGTDFIRKILILARECGHEVEFAQGKVEPILPLQCLEAESVADFYRALREHDRYFEELKNKAAKQNSVLRYIGTLENGHMSISLQIVDNTHPFYALSGSDNIISIQSTRYSETPLVIKGPGAGAEVTAAGVFANVLSLSKRV